MEPIKTRLFDGVYGAPIGFEDEIGGLPYYREHGDSIASNMIYSVWEPSDFERYLISKGANILVGQMGEPIRPMSVVTTNLQRVEDAEG